MNRWARHCSACGRFVRRGAAACHAETPDLFARAEMGRRIQAGIDAMFPCGTYWQARREQQEKGGRL